MIDDEIRNMINDCQSPGVLRNRARALGMRTLREDGIRKVLAGMTTRKKLSPVRWAIKIRVGIEILNRDY